MDRQLMRKILTILATLFGGVACAGQMAPVSQPDPYAITELPGEPVGNSSSVGRVTQPPIPNTWPVLVYLGQSTIAGNATGTYTTVSANAQMMNVYDGGIFPCANPVLGSSIPTTLGSNGVSCQTADGLIGSGTYPGVLIVNIAIDGTSVANWQGAQLQTRITAAWNRLSHTFNASGAPLTTNPMYVYWHQGEQETGLGTLGPPYTTGVQAVATQWRNLGYTGPFFVATETVVSNAPNPTIATAQANAVSTPLHIVAGANWDQFTGATYRQADGTHPTAAGASAFAGVDVTVITNCKNASC
jgi:hypothetical protein